MPTIQNRRASKSQWALLNPVLAAGEVGVELGDTLKLKVGNGLTPWNLLKYIGDGASIDPEILELIETGRLSEEALDGTYAAQAKTVESVQSALDDGAAQAVPVFVTPGTHMVTRTTADDRRAVAVPAKTQITGMGTLSVIELDPADPPQAILSHAMLLGTTSNGVSDVTIERVRLEINQRKIARWSRIVSRQVASDNSYCTVNTLTDHYLSVGDSVTIINTELAALNATLTVSAIISAKSFRVTGVSSSNKALIVQTLDATVRLAGTPGSIDGICSIPNSVSTSASNDVIVRDAIINGTSNAVRATIIRAAPAGVFHKRWLVQNVRGHDFTNKAVEFGFVDGGKVIDCHFTGCADGLQAIFWSKNIEFIRTYQSYYLTGINITSGSHDVKIDGVVSEAEANTSKGLKGPALIFRTENTAGENYDSYNIQACDSVFRNTVTDSRDVLAFTTMSAVASSVYRDSSFVNVTFDGAVRLYEQLTPAKATIYGFRFTSSRIKTLVTVSYATSKVYDTVFTDCDFTDDVVINASDMRFINCRFKGGVTISVDALDVVMKDCVTGSAIVDNAPGGSTLENNAVRSTYPRP